MLAVKSAVEDLAAIVVGHQCTTGGSPQRLSLVGKAGTDAVARRYQIQRPAVDWDFEDSSGKPRAVDDRFARCTSPSRRYVVKRLLLAVSQMTKRGYFSKTISARCT